MPDTMTIDERLRATAAALKTIGALAENPHWTASRRWEIARLAQHARQQLDAAQTALRDQEAM